MTPPVAQPRGDEQPTSSVEGGRLRPDGRVRFDEEGEVVPTQPEGPEADDVGNGAAEAESTGIIEAGQGPVPAPLGRVTRQLGEGAEGGEVLGSCIDPSSASTSVGGWVAAQ